eukprot:CCRYP_016320-RA/>CCRYP_016320-RA protein AED:0.34 eAED:0.34 QI:105/1/1/1/1/1/2/310/906
MTMAIIRRAGRRSEPCLNDLEGQSVLEPILSIRHACSNDNVVDVDHPAPPTKVGTSWFSRRRRQRIRSVSPSPRSSSSVWQRLFSVPLDIRISQIGKYLRSKNPTHVAFVAVLLFVGLWCYASFLAVVFLGPRGSVKGGQLGYLIDQFTKDYTRYHTISKWRDEIRNELHIPLVYSEQDGALLEPRFWPLDTIIKTRPNAAVVEMLLREKRRVQHLHDTIQSTASLVGACSREPNSAMHIPRTILQLEYQPGQLIPLLPYWIMRSELLEVDAVTVNKKDIATLSPSIDLHQCRNIISGTENYAMSLDMDLHCVAFVLGGMQLSILLSNQYRTLIEAVLRMIKTSSTRSQQHDIAGTISLEGSCNSKIGYAVLSNSPTPESELRKASSISSFVSTVYTALPPNHPAALCLPPFHDTMGISPYHEANMELSFQSIFANRLTTTISHAMNNLTLNNTSTVWGVAVFSCDFKTHGLHCCNHASVSALNSLDVNIPDSFMNAVNGSYDNSRPNHKLIFTVTDVVDSTAAKSKSTVPISVSIEEKFYTSANSVSHTKQSIQESLKSCEPGWWCNRCLQTSMYGSFSKCTSVCRECVADIICNGSNIFDHHKVTIHVHAKESSLTSLTQHRMQHVPVRIPRIIHQTWFEDITLDSYPQLFRLQNTWRASGWEYRFYTDATARKYIEANYPRRFVTVFDSLVPGAYKADFFRYLVLYKDGGIYVDVDVMLNTNLDSFITPDIAFFAPIDAVGSYADEHFCIWNGFLGSAPASPILTNVIEWMVNMVSIRGDMYDMERAVCHFSGDPDRIENWKIRAEPSLMLSGPCALGLAVNNALGNEPLAKFGTGLITRSGFNQRNDEAVNKDLIGDVLILVVRCILCLNSRAQSFLIYITEPSRSKTNPGRQARSRSFSLQ